MEGLSEFVASPLDEVLLEEDEALNAALPDEGLVVLDVLGGPGAGHVDAALYDHWGGLDDEPVVLLELCGDLFLVHPGVDEQEGLLDVPLIVLFGEGFLLLLAQLLEHGL